MTYQDIATQARRLPLRQRLELLEVLTSSLKDDLEPRLASPSSLARIHGIAKTDGEMTADFEEKDDYTTYLLRKYS